MRTRTARFSRTLIAVVIVLAFALTLVLVSCNKEAQNPLSTQATTQLQQTSLSKSAQLQAAMAVQEKHTHQLLSMRGVVGTAIGATPDGRTAVLVYTLDQGAGAAVPSALDGYPVIVEATGPFFAYQSNEAKGGNKPPSGGGGGGKIDPTGFFTRPVPIGVSTGNRYECSSGTISARVTDASGNIYALSNNHVYALENDAPLGSAVVQPGLYDNNCVYNSDNGIGTLARFITINFNSGTNTVDAAIALTSTADLGNATPTNGYGTPSSTTVSAYIGQAVQKYGRTTSLTKGTVTGINATVTVDYGASGTATFANQIIISAKKPFSKAGDSGSLIVTNDSNAYAVGLLFAGTSNGTTIANQIGDVLSALHVSIDGK
jgi:hypothetical protein